MQEKIRYLMCIPRRGYLLGAPSIGKSSSILSLSRSSSIEVNGVSGACILGDIYPSCIKLVLASLSEGDG